MTQKISGYTVRAKRLRGIDLVDNSEDDGGGGYVSKSVTGLELENVLSEKIGLDCIDANIGNYVMTLVVDTAMKMFPKYVTFQNTAGGKNSGLISFKIGSSSGDDDIMPLTLLAGFADGLLYTVDLEGILPELLSASSSINLSLVTGSDATANIVDIRVHGNQFDV